MKKGLVGSLFVVGIFLIILFVHYVLGGDKAQGNRSDWFPLYYIIPLMILGGGIIYYLANKNE